MHPMKLEKERKQFSHSVVEPILESGGVEHGVLHIGNI